VTGVRVVADHTWAGRWVKVDEVLRAQDSTLRGAIVRVEGTVVPGLRDHHVHLGLIDHGRLAGSALSAVDDLGWIPSEVLRWKESRAGNCAVRVAGPFLTAPGGYPSGRPWAPPDAVVEIASPEHGAETVRQLARAGVDLIKVALHTGMPSLDDRALAGIVETAHEQGLPAVAHTEGDGQAARALVAGVDVLAHTPWTERLSDALVMDMAGRIAWISTLAIQHEAARVVATDNLTRFVRAGGQVLYGTDMGNGPTPVDLNDAEVGALVAAGLPVDSIMNALCCADHDLKCVTWTPHDPPGNPSDLSCWLATLRRRSCHDFGAAS
jgi:hypothetical protein